MLKQQAHFYNNIGTEMVPCQKPMMLQDALEFEQVGGRGAHCQGWVASWHRCLLPGLGASAEPLRPGDAGPAHWLALTHRCPPPPRDDARRC